MYMNRMTLRFLKRRKMYNQQPIDPWPSNATPTSYIDNYRGPYPIRELARARRTLIECVRQCSSPVIERVKPRIGLNSAYGPGLISPPINYDSPETRLYLKNIPDEDQPGRIKAPPQKDATNNSHTQTGLSQTFTESPPSREQIPLHTSSSAPARLWESHSLATQKRSASPSMAGPSNTKRPKQSHQNEPAFFSGINTSPLEPSTSGNSDSEAGGFQMWLKCDDCSYMDQESSSMEDHLINYRHHSASQYLTQPNPGKSQRKLISVEKKLAVVNKSSSKYSRVIACPECKQIFSSIFECGDHYQKLHDPSKGCYVSCFVASEGVVTVSPERRCLVCNQLYVSKDALWQHWMSKPHHNPMPKSTSAGVHQVVMCPFCNDACFSDLVSCLRHVYSDHKDETNKDKPLGIKSLTILLPASPETLPPYGVVKSLTSLFNHQA